MAEQLILPVAHLIYPFKESPVRGQNGAEREGVNAGTARFFLLQRRPSRNRRIDRHIVMPVHFLEIGAQSHHQQTDQRYVIFFAEIHQPFRRLRLEMENIQGGFHRVRHVKRRAHIRISGALPRLVKPPRAVNTIIYRLRGFNQFAEKFFVALFRAASGLICQILFQLRDIGRHLLRVWHILIHRVTVDLNHIFQKTDDRLRIHREMIHQHVDSAVAVRQLYHDNPVLRRIVMLKRNFRPALHHGICLLHRLSREIHKFNITLFPVNHILIPVAFLVLCKAQPHGLASLVRLVNGLFQLLKIQLHLDHQAVADIEHLFFRAEIQIEKMEFLSHGQRVYLISFSRLHHFTTPPINSSIARSYASVSL